MARKKVTRHQTTRDRMAADRQFCPVAEAARLLGDKWTLIVLRDLADGPRRFKDLEQSGEGVSPSVLASRLRDLEEQGLITRTSYNEIPPRVEYNLTPKGCAALDVVAALRAFGERWLTPTSTSPEPHDRPSR